MTNKTLGVLTVFLSLFFILFGLIFAGIYFLNRSPNTVQAGNTPQLVSAEVYCTHIGEVFKTELGEVYADEEFLELENTIDSGFGDCIQEADAMEQKFDLQKVADFRSCIMKATDLESIEMCRPEQFDTQTE